jgi:hypothetical protein
MPPAVAPIAAPVAAPTLAHVARLPMFAQPAARKSTHIKRISHFVFIFPPFKKIIMNEYTLLLFNTRSNSFLLVYYKK